MKKIFLILTILGLGSFQLFSQQGNNQYHFKIGKLKYEGGGDWYSNPTSLPNLIAFINEHTNVRIDEVEDVVEAGGSQIYQYPYVYMTGHGNVSFTDAEAKNLRQYLISGGFLHIDDNYGMDKYIRREMKKVFPELEFVDLPFNHGIYNSHFIFPKGLPKIHEHDNKPPEGLALIYEGNVVCYYTYETDLGDGWEDQLVHNDPEELRQQSLMMGANIVVWAINH
ncbi:MAG: DUF4159 domain-containing protein [Bacteroidetes bacterium]|nr:DUF4159 domain-containing protein [Bacteroidota bacterium]